MTRRPVRLTLLVLFVASMGAAAYLFWIAEQEGRSADRAARRFDADAEAVVLSVADLRSAEQGYVAAGQGADFWFARSSALLTDVKSRLAALRASASSPQAASGLDDASATLQDVEQMDGRAREYTRSRQLTLASDLIFSDGMDLARKLMTAIDQARTAEASARDAAAAALQRREVFSLGAAAAASTAIVLLLMPVGAKPEPVLQVPVRSTVPATAAPRSTVDLPPAGLDEGWTPARRGATQKPAGAPTPIAPAAAAPKPGAAASPAPVAAQPSIDLQAVSAICTDFAKVVDTRTLPSLLERAAQVLDAAGVILWVADPDGRELAPIVTHGYPANLVTRLGTIPRDAENATAAAFRTGLLQTVKADAVSNGAIAAPLLTGTGCVGVMAAEVRHEAERQQSVLAAAGIFAAQLATLVGPPSTRAKAEAAG